MSVFDKSSHKYFIPVLAVSCLLMGAYSYVLYQHAPAHPFAIGLSTLVFFCVLIATNIVFYLLLARHIRRLEKNRKNEELFSTVINGVNDGIFDWDPADNSIRYCTSYRKILGYSEEELGYSHTVFESLMHPEDLPGVWQAYNDYSEYKIPAYHVIFRMRHKDGHWVWVQSRGVAMRDEQGKVRRMIGTHTDITLQKLREEEMQQLMRENERQREELHHAKERAEAASQAKTNFLATMSHEIRTPMNAVLGLARLMMNTTLDQKQQAMMQTLQANADVLLHLVNDLLDLSRIEAAQITINNNPFVVSSIFSGLRGIFENQVTSKGLLFSLVDHCEEQIFIGDMVRIQQILVNLIGNALKFTTHGGILVTAACEKRSDGKADLRLQVADTGVGIAPEKMNVIFDKFVQGDQTIARRYGGSGLGLAICRSLARLLGGDITVNSRLHEGSTFTLQLSVELGHRRPETPRVEQSAQVPASAGASTGTVLVIDDYPSNILVATMMLEQMGYAVEAASSGIEAINRVQARETPYDAILMDVQMPGMDGYETTKQLRAIEKRKGFRHFIIGVTAHAFAEDRDRCMAAGMDGYVSKPIDMDLLAKKLTPLSKKAAA